MTLGELRRALDEDLSNLAPETLIVVLDRNGFDAEDIVLVVGPGAPPEVVRLLPALISERSDDGT